MQTLPFDTSTLNFYKSGKLLTVDYYLNDGDDIITSDKVLDKESRAGRLAKAIAEGLSDKPAETEAEEKDTAPEASAAASAVPEAIAQSETPQELPKPQEPQIQQEPRAFTEPAPQIAAEPAPIPQPAAEIPAAVTEITSAAEAPAEENEEVPVIEDFSVVLNGKTIMLEPRPANMPHEFIELMALADIDLDNPPPDGNMILTLNGKDVSFMDVINNGDVAVIRWANQ